MDPSPLTRGKLTLTPSLPLPHWLIPAHAGENVHDARLEGDGRGLSPLTRGKPGRTPVRSTPAGLIPAHAGKTNSAGLYPISLPAHPSSRGENSYEASVTFPRPGSSQLTREKRSVTVPVNITARLIPAHAGKTRWSAPKHPPNSAHPRSRGENVVICLPPSDTAGSSPLTRGKPRLLQAVGLLRRLIPSHAGKTVGGTDTTLENPAHPRSRGENRFSPPDWPLVSGSSPLTRGKHQDLGYRCDGLRLIPAHAGKTSTRRTRTSAPAAHPRSRGENRVLKPGGYMLAGSSPLTRGKPREVLKIEVAARLIPAHAGKTKSRPAM